MVAGSVGLLDNGTQHRQQWDAGLTFFHFALPFHCRRFGRLRLGPVRFRVFEVFSLSLFLSRAAAFHFCAFARTGHLAAVGRIELAQLSATRRAELSLVVFVRSELIIVAHDSGAGRVAVAGRRFGGRQLLGVDVHRSGRIGQHLDAQILLSRDNVRARRQLSRAIVAAFTPSGGLITTIIDGH